MYKELSDEELIKLVADNNKEAFNEIYKRYEKPIYNYLNRLVFDKDMLNEIFQEIFAKIYFKAKTFKKKYKFKSWIYKISMNQYIDYYKRLKRQNKIIGKKEDLSNYEYNAPDTIDNIIEDETLKQLETFLNRLPEKYQQAVILKKLEGFTFDQVAEIMGVTSRSVKTYVAKGIEKLKELFQQTEKKDA